MFLLDLVPATARLVLMALALLFITLTVLPTLRHDWWVVRACDFPRQQIAVAGIGITGVYVGLWDTRTLAEDVVLVGLVGAVLYQGYWLYPYGPYAAPQVQTTDSERPDRQLSVLVANVQYHNPNVDFFRRLVDRHDPDVLLALETNTRWVEALEPVEARYPHVVTCPRDDAYGMSLYARYPLVEPEVRFLVEGGVPSIATQVELPAGERVWLYGVHPRPPHPEEHADTISRDAELLLVGHEVEERRAEGAPTIVAGDFNDVPWSYITTLFQAVSGLVDPRVGRGPYNTFHARYPLLRCPLDHVYHSCDFTLAGMERLPYFGSDHFAILTCLQLDDEAADEQTPPRASAVLRQHAREEIAKAFDDPRHAPLRPVVDGEKVVR